MSEVIRISQRIRGSAPAQAVLSLPYEYRRRSRLRTRLVDGREVALFLERGAVLRHGDLLRSDDGTVVRVEAAPETVSTAMTDKRRLLARACYHLGNRHVAVQIGERWVRYLCDPVLDEMLFRLGLTVEHELTPFEPEPGAYHGGAHH